MIKKITAIVLFTLLTACATTQIEITPFDSSKTYQKSYNEAWSSLVRFFSTNQIAIGTLEKDSGIITLNGTNLDAALVRSYCAVEVPFLATFNGGSAQGSATLVEDSGFVTANVNVRFTASFASCDLYGRCTYSNRPCRSNGTFEKALLAALE